MSPTRILGTGSGIPAKVLSNQDLEKLLDTSDEWIMERTGIKERRVLEEGRVTSDLATEAAMHACEAANVDPRTIDCILIATVTPDMPFPATAVFVQKKLGIAQCAAFDISAACAGFVYAIAIGDAFVQTGQYQRVLVVGVEILSRVVDKQDRSTYVLFGDAAGAVLRGPAAPGDRSDRGIWSTHLFADGEGADQRNLPGGGTKHRTSAETVAENMHVIKMNGRSVFSHAVRNIASACTAALERNGITSEQVDMVLAHQANLRIVEGVAQRLNIPLSKFHLNIESFGNTLTASIPIALDEAVRAGKVKPGMTLLFCALGAGFSWGSALVRW